MNIFDDLIDELKQENLLEKTNEETKSAANKPDSAGEKAIVGAAAVNGDAPVSDSASGDARHPEATDAQTLKQAAPAPTSGDKTEFFRRRATDEVAGLQLVEHVFSGIERDRMKTIPKPYDDLRVKKVLHEFLQVSADVDSPEHASAEFELMQETESWYSALSHRDKQISVANLRRFCEAARPALSTSALLALARFYRNSPYSEAVRSKFDLIVTRLFSKDLTGETRELTFDRDDLMRHLSELYAEWSSVSLYAGDEEDESKIVLTAFKFEDFMNEAQKATSFDELIRNDFFNRLRTFKQEAGEQFFSPLVTATAVECNIRIGNRYVGLLELEKERGEIERLENKYGFLHDQVISDAASKSLQLVDLLKAKTAPPEPESAEPENETSGSRESAQRQTPKPAPSPTPEKGFLGVNKWLLAAAGCIIFVSVGLALWSNFYDASEKIAADIKKVDVDNSSLKDYVRDARIGNETFFAVVLPSWNGLSVEKKEEILRKIAAVGAEKGFRNVHLLSADGKSVGSVAGDLVEVRN